MNVFYLIASVVAFLGVWVCTFKSALAHDVENSALWACGAALCFSFGLAFAFGV